MLDALWGNRPALVRLFVENGLDVGQFLTWGQLEDLYGRTPEVSLLHQLLERCQGAGPESSPPTDYLLLERSLPDCQLQQVAQILRDLLGDVCAPFYPGLHSSGYKGLGVGWARGHAGSTIGISKLVWETGAFDESLTLIT